MRNTTVDWDDFGPLVDDYQDYFDFTPLFEDVIFSLSPSVLITVVGLIRIIYLLRHPKRLLARKLQYTKLLSIICYGCLQLPLIVLWNRNPGARSPATIAASCLSLCNALVLCVLSYAEHARNIRPSGILLVYLFFSVVFDSLRLRTLWYVKPSSPIVALFTTSLVLKGLMLLLEAKEKTLYLPAYYHFRRPEETSSILNRGIFWWLNNILWMGARKFLAPNDVYELDHSLASEALSQPFINSWQSIKRDKSKNSVIKALAKTLRWPVLSAVPSRILLLILTVCQPVLLRKFLQYLQSPGNQSTSIGRGLIAAYSLVYVGLAVTTGFYWHAHYRVLTMLRGCLISALNWQTARLDLLAVGDPKNTLTLMSSDVEHIMDGFQNFHELWANASQIAFAAYFLSIQMGLAAIVPVILGVVGAAGTTLTSKASGPRQKRWMEAVEQRISLMSSVLTSMKEVKMKGLSDILETLVKDHRQKEMYFSGRSRMVIVLTVGCAFIPEFLSPAATFLIFFVRSKNSGHSFDAANAFTSTALITILTRPLNDVFKSLPRLIAALASLGRVEKYMCADEQEDFRNLRLEDSPKRLKVNADNRLEETAEGIALNDLQKIAGSSNGDSSSAGISVTDGCFGWEHETVVLRDTSITIPSGKLTILVGPVAAGKSTLCKTLLGETKAMKGRVDVEVSNGRISFCDQTAFLKNATIKENIISYSHPDESWYNSVIFAAALWEDIAALPRGDATQVGSNGVNLSGGQRHKVALARALYARNSILILDDIFSGLDSRSAEHVFKHAIGPRGLVRNHGGTIVFATHATHLIPQADHVIVMDSDGRISQEGHYRQLVLQSGYIQDLKIIEHIERNQEQQENDRSEIPGSEHKLPVAIASELEVARQQGDFATYRYYFSATGILSTISAVILAMICSFSTNFAVIWLKFWTDASGQPGKPNTALYLGVYTALQILSLLSLVWLAYEIIVRMVTKAGIDLHNRALKAVMAAPLLLFSSTDTGAITNRFSQDLTLIDGQLALGLLDTVYTSCQLLGQMILIGVSSPLTAASFPLIGIVFYFIQKFYLRTSRQVRFLDLEAKSPLYTHFLETTTGLSTIRAFGWIMPNHEAGQKLLDNSQRPLYLLYLIQRWLTFVLDMVVACLAAVIATIAVTQQSGSGFAGVALSQLMTMNLSMKYLILEWTDVETSIGAVNRIKSFSEQTPVEHKARESTELPESWPSEGKVEFRNVTALYDEAKPDQQALKDISLTISPGGKVAICGRSGSGKSSTILTLFHMLEFDETDLEGTVFIDGVDIRTIQRNVLRSRLNVLPQHPFFLHGTIRQNLDPTMTIPDSQLLAALDQVGLNKLISMPSSAISLTLDSHFKPTSLSHGQRQLFALASAIIRKRKTNSKIVVLDEVTSNLDHVTDMFIQRIIREEFADCTIIAVAHRLNTIVDFDRVVVLDHGKIVETGNPSDLLKQGRSTSNFARMWDSMGGGDYKSLTLTTAAPGEHEIGEQLETSRT